MPSDRLLEWIQRQEELAFEAEELIRKKGFYCTTLREDRKPLKVRIIISPKEFKDFRIKEVKSSYAKDFWIAKVVDVHARSNFLIHSKTEGHWLWVSGPMLLAKAERKESSYHNNAIFLVAPRSLLKNFSRMVTDLKKKHEESKQKVLSEWMKE